MTKIFEDMRSASWPEGWVRGIKHLQPKICTGGAGQGEDSDWSKRTMILTAMYGRVKRNEKGSYSQEPKRIQRIDS